MKITLPDIRSILEFSATYRFFSSIVGGRARFLYIKEYVKPKYGDKILDIGCGPGDILKYLPHVEYLGFDINRRYIEKATKKFGNRGRFICKKLSRELREEFSDFDIVLATGILHHLDDDEAIQLFKLALSALNPGGRLITLDGCYMKEQSCLATFILSKDRGRYVRTKDEYVTLASKVFRDIKVSIHDDLIRIPYTHIIMECRA